MQDYNKRIQLITEAVSSIGSEVDIPGLAEELTHVDPNSESFWDTVYEHTLTLMIDWKMSGHRRYAEWEVKTKANGVIARGEVEVTSDNNRNFNIVEGEIARDGFRLADAVNIEDEWAEFLVYRPGGSESACNEL